LLNASGGDHHIFTREGVIEILNIQPRGSKAKPYQVKQVRELIVSYGLAGTPEGADPKPQDAGDTDSEEKDEA
jgi:hypothetical protein